VTGSPVSAYQRAERIIVPNTVRSHSLCRYYPQVPGSSVAVKPRLGILSRDIEIGLSGFGPGPNPCRSTHRWPLIRQVLASATVGCPLPKVSEHLAEYFKRDAFPPLTPP
jgi:hypothetical protein